MKTKFHIQLKRDARTALLSNVIYEFICLREADLGVTSRHLFARVQQHLHLVINKAAISQHLNSCQFCGNSKPEIGNYKIISYCNNDSDVIYKICS